MKKRVKLQAAILAVIASSSYADESCLTDVENKEPLEVFQCVEAKLNHLQKQMGRQQSIIQLIEQLESDIKYYMNRRFGQLEKVIQAQQAQIEALKMRLSLTDGLVAYYPFDSHANDVSGNGHHGEVHGATLVKGKFGNAYSFNGKDSRIKLSASAIQGIELTVNLWIKTKDNDYGLVSGANQSSENEYVIYFYPFLAPHYHSDYKNTNISVSDNQWHSLTVVTKIAQTRVYVDGLPKQTLRYGSKTPFKVEGLWLGGEQDSLNGGWELSQQFEGIMDELRIYNRALTDFEIQNLYKQR